MKVFLGTRLDMQRERAKNALMRAQLDNVAALALYVKDGNPPEDWSVVDECVRSHYRHLAAQSAETTLPASRIQ